MKELELQKKIQKYLEDQTKEILLKDLISKFKKEENFSESKIKKNIYEMAINKFVEIDSNHKFIILKKNLNGSSLKNLLNSKPEPIIERQEENFEDDFSYPDIKCESKSYTWSPQQICTMIEEKKIIFPNYQRNYKWTSKQASSFIESLIFGLPVPSIFVYQNKNQVYEIIDGQQRITALNSFIQSIPLPNQKRNFKLQKNVVDYLQDKSFETKDKNKRLSNENKFKLKYYPINVTEFLTDDDKPAMLFQIFKRLNSGGTPLNNDEIRKAIFSSKFYNKLIKLSEIEEWAFFFTSKEIENAKPFGWLLRCLMIFCFHDYNKLPDIQKPAFKPLQIELNDFSEVVKILSNKDSFKDSDIKKYENLWSYNYFKEKNLISENIIDFLINTSEKSIKNIFNKFDEDAFKGKKRNEEIIGGANKTTIAEALFTIANNNEIINIKNSELSQARESVVLSEKFISTLISSTNTANIIKRIEIFNEKIFKK